MSKKLPPNLRFFAQKAHYTARKKDTRRGKAGQKLRMKPKSSKVLPKTAADIINGGLYEQAVRCGKATCRCASGTLHTGYYYFLRRVDGRLRKTYVPKSQAERISGLISEHRRNRENERSTRISDGKLLAALRAQMRENDLLIRTLADAIRHNDQSRTNY